MGLSFSECLSMSSKCDVFWTGWGTVATTVVGVVTVGVAVLAWLTSRRAAKIADEATVIASQQRDESLRLKEDAARIVGRLLFSEIGTVPARAARIVRGMRKAVGPGESFSTLTSVRDYDRAMFEARQDLLPTAEHVLDKIHTLPDSLGADLAMLISSCMTLKAMAVRVEARVVRFSVDTETGEKEVIKFSDGPGDYVAMLDQALWVVRYGAQFANSFQRFVGVPLHEYSHLISEFES